MFGFIAPVPAALIQELIDVAVILNALRALRPAVRRRSRVLPAATGQQLRHDHVTLGHGLDRLRNIADALDDASPETVVGLIDEANTIVQQQVVAHERDDEGNVYPAVARLLAGDRAGLSAMIDPTSLEALGRAVDRVRTLGALLIVTIIRTSEHFHVFSPPPRLSVRMFGSGGKKRAKASSNCATL